MSIVWVMKWTEPSAKRKFVPPRVPRLEAPGECPVVIGMVGRGAPAVVVIEISRVVDGDGRAAVVVATVGLRPAGIPIPVHPLMRQVVVPTDDALTDHQGVRQAVDHVGDVYLNPLLLARYQGGAAKHPQQLA